MHYGCKVEKFVDEVINNADAVVLIDLFRFRAPLGVLLVLLIYLFQILRINIGSFDLCICSYGIRSVLYEHPLTSVTCLTTGAKDHPLPPTPLSRLFFSI